MEPRTEDALALGTQGQEEVACGGGRREEGGMGPSRSCQVWGCGGGKSPRRPELLVRERPGLRNKVGFYSDARGSPWSRLSGVRWGEGIVA